MKKNLDVLLLAASHKDSELTKSLLADFGIESQICSSLSNLIANIDEHAGVIVIAKEVLDASKIEELTENLKRQPTWSSLPVIMLLSAGDLTSSIALDLVAPIPNVTLLERPVRQRALTSVVKSALADRKRQLELRDSLNEAIEANRAKSEFLANMSHEIRTPLGAILGFSELIAESGISDDDRKLYLETIQRNGQLLTAIINDILDLAKIEAGRLQIEPTEISTNELLSEIISSLEPKARQKGVKILVEKDGDLPEIFVSDPVRLKQILLNIVGNALKFTPKGEVKIVTSIRNESQGLKNREILSFQIKDTGIGIKPEQASLLFQSFSQADSSITRKFGGTGLGLVLSQKLARALGGDLKLVESKFGVGSTFEISIEFKEKKKSALLSKNLNEKQFTNNELAGTHILIVDDSLDNQFLIKQLLTKLGAEVSLAENGQEGIEKAIELNPDIVLMDVQMPVLSGIDAARELRRQQFSKPIIALTAHALKGDREQCLTAGYSDYLTKPINRVELVNNLKQALSTKPNLRAHPREEYVFHKEYNESLH